MSYEMNFQLWFHTLDGIGGKKARELISVFGGAKEIYYASESGLQEVKGITQKDVDTILYRRNTDKIKQMEEELFRKKIAFIAQGDEAYPSRLNHLYDAPYALFVKGRLPQEEELIFAMVGARMCTPYGKNIAKDLAATLAGHGGSVVSGMARGIDGYSHAGCLDAGGRTYAVLAGGVDVVYPPEHRNLYDRILENGGIISEYAPGTQPLKGMFPQRNRIISGLANKVIVVEAKERSGSLITADFALEQGKDVYVVPGRIGDPLSAGCNSYIKQGASIIDSIPNFMRDVSLTDEISEMGKREKKIYLEKEESIVYSCLRLTPSSLDEITSESELDLLTVIRCISKLEELGLAEEYFKNHYIRSA